MPDPNVIVVSTHTGNTHSIVIGTVRSNRVFPGERSTMTNVPTPTDRYISPSEPMCNLHMLVPVAARRHAKVAAVASGIPFREYVARLLLQANPITATDVEHRAKERIISAIAAIPADSGVECVRDVATNVVSNHGDASM